MIGARALIHVRGTGIIVAIHLVEFGLKRKLNEILRNKTVNI